MIQAQDGPAWTEQKSNPSKWTSTPQPLNTPQPCKKKHTYMRKVHAHTPPEGTPLTCWLNRRLGPIEKMWEYGSLGIFWGWAKKNRNATWLETLETCYKSLNTEPILLTDSGYNPGAYLRNEIHSGWLSFTIKLNKLAPSTLHKIDNFMRSWINNPDSGIRAILLMCDKDMHSFLKGKTMF